MPATTTHLLTSRQACDRLGVDRSTLTRWVQLGRLEVAMRVPGYKGALLFTPEAVEAKAKEMGK